MILILWVIYVFLPPLAPNDAMINVKNVKNSGAQAAKYDICTVPSSLLVIRTKNTSSGITKKLYPVIRIENYFCRNLYTYRYYTISTIPKAELVEVLLCSALISVIRNKIPAKIMVYKTPTSEMHKTIHNGTNVISHGHEMTLKKYK